MTAEQTETTTPGLAPALAFSLLLHLALLQLLPLGSWGEDAAAPQSAPLQARLSPPGRAVAPEKTWPALPQTSVATASQVTKKLADSAEAAAAAPNAAPNAGPNATPNTNSPRAPSPAGMHTAAQANSASRAEPLPPAVLLAPYYFSASELQFPAGPVRPIPLGLPEDGSSLSGRVVLLVLLNAQGKPDQISVVSSDLPPAYAAAAKAGFAAGEYQPGRIGNQRLPSRMLVEVLYQPFALPRAQRTDGSVLPLTPVPSAAEK